MTQKAQEGKLWEEIERKKASKRQATSTGGKNPQLMDNVPQAEKQLEKGAIRDIIAEKIGVGSGRTYERAKNAVNKIDELKKK